MKTGVDDLRDCRSCGPVMTGSSTVAWVQDPPECSQCNPEECARIVHFESPDSHAAFLDPARQREARRLIESEFP